MTCNVSVYKADADSDDDGSANRNLRCDLKFNAAVQLLRF